MTTTCDLYRSTSDPTKALLFDGRNWYKIEGHYGTEDVRLGAQVKPSEAREWLVKNGHKAA